MGKSSLIHTLLLLLQFYERNTLFDKGLLLKGEYATLGTGRDVLAEQSETNNINSFLTWSEQKPLQLCINYAPQSDLQPIERHVFWEKDYPLKK